MKSSRLLRGMLVILVFFVIIAGWDALGHPGWPISSPTNPTEVLTDGSPTPQTVQRTLPATLSVSGTQWGMSTCYIGAAEGSSRFSITDLQDLGINTYRIYGGMNRWEAHDDGSAYGLPTIAQIQRNPNVINWAKWDTAMTNPPHGSDYWWDPKLPEWHGNARTLFSTLNAAHIRIMIALRNQDDQHNPQWMANPPTTTADWNEWWEHVFATVYWLNVRNHYHVYDFEIGNEPNIPAQGWRGTQAQYFTFARYTSDAIAYVFKTYLPRQVYH